MAHFLLNGSHVALFFPTFWAGIIPSQPEQISNALPHARLQERDVFPVQLERL